MATQTDSADEIRDTLADEYLLELTHTVDEERRTHLVVPIEAYRPSMLPATGPPSFLFQPVGTGDRLLVRLPDVLDLHPIDLDESTPDLLDAALETLAGVAATDPRLLTSDTVSPALEDAIELGDPQVAGLAAIVASRCTGVHDTDYDVLDSSRVDDATLVSDLVELAVPESPHLETATVVLADIAESEPADALDAVPRLTAIAADGDLATRQYALYALNCIADDYPEQVSPAVNTLVTAIESTDETVQTNATGALGRIASGYPDAVAPIVDDVAELLNSESKQVRNNAAGLLADIAQEHPVEVIAYADDLVGALEESAHQTRINASIALLEAGEADPEAVRSHHQQLAAALEDPTPAVRANVCTLVGNADAPVSIERLRDLRNDDPNQTVRDRATWALERRT